MIQFLNLQLLEEIIHFLRPRIVRVQVRKESHILFRVAQRNVEFFRRRTVEGVVYLLVQLIRARRFERPDDQKDDRPQHQRQRHDSESSDQIRLRRRVGVRLHVQLLLLHRRKDRLLKLVQRSRIQVFPSLPQLLEGDVSRLHSHLRQLWLLGSIPFAVAIPLPFISGAGKFRVPLLVNARLDHRARRRAL